MCVLAVIKSHSKVYESFDDWMQPGRKQVDESEEDGYNDDWIEAGRNQLDKSEEGEGEKGEGVKRWNVRCEGEKEWSETGQGENNEGVKRSNV